MNEVDKSIIALQHCASGGKCGKCVFADKPSLSSCLNEFLCVMIAQKKELDRMKNSKVGKCGSCAYAVPTTFAKSTNYVECTNKEHIEKFCKRPISLKRPHTTPACKCYVEREDL